MIPDNLVDSIHSLKPDSIANYLRSSGWTESSLDENISLWHRPEEEFESFELLQPLTKKFRDYSQRVFELVENLTNFEKRAFEEVLDELSNFHADVVKIRVSHDDVESGSIPLDDGVRLFEKTRELFVSIAKSTFSKKKYFGGGKLSEEIANFLDTIRLGQTERGSYIVNLIAPIELIPQDQNDFDKVSVTRSVTKTLARSLTAIDSSINDFKSTNSLTAFDSAVEKGVSANLCDAILGLSGDKRSRNINISISLSQTEELSEEIKLTHRFEVDALPYLEKASEYYKDNYVIPNKTISGLVIKLTHEPNEDSGTVVIDAIVNDRQKNVTVELPIDEYWQSHRAHKRQQPVEVTGDLHVTQKTAKLLDGRNFKAFGDNDLFPDQE